MIKKQIGKDGMIIGHETIYKNDQIAVHSIMGPLLRKILVWHYNGGKT